MEKLKESLEAVVPIIVIVLILSFTIAPVPPGILMAFIIGAILLIVGMMFFTLGAEMSMTPMGRTDRYQDRTVEKAAGDHRVVFLYLDSSSRYRSRICRCWQDRYRRYQI